MGRDSILVLILRDGNSLDTVEQHRNAARTYLAARTAVTEFAVLLAARLAAGRTVAMPAKGKVLPTAASARFSRRTSTATTLEKPLASLAVSSFVPSNDRCRKFWLVDSPRLEGVGGDQA